MAGSPCKPTRKRVSKSTIILFLMFLQALQTAGCVGRGLYLDPQTKPFGCLCIFHICGWKGCSCVLFCLYGWFSIGCWQEQCLFEGFFNIVTMDKHWGVAFSRLACSVLAENPGKPVDVGQAVSSPPPPLTYPSGLVTPSCHPLGNGCV